jgi:hypothetical protein
MTRVLGWTLVGLLGWGSVAEADSATLDDFQNADGKKGCESIPYGSIRDTCSRKSESVKDWCKNSSRKISCDDLDRQGLQSRSRT